MTYAQIMVATDIGPTAADRVRLAAGLAEKCHASLVGVSAGDVMVPVHALRYDPTLVNLAQERASAVLKEAETLFRREVPVELTATWRSSTEPPLDYLLKQGRVADLLVIARQGPSDGDAGLFRFDAAALLMEFGRPILVVPPGIGRLDPIRAVIAWKDTREARRALADAVPLLRLAEETVLVAFGSDADRSGIEDAAAYLVRHGARVSTKVVSEIEVSVSEDLLGLVADLGADLLVTGAYGHSRLREWILGGVTADLLAGTSICCLMTH